MKMKKGSTLIEVMVAILIITIAILAILELTNKSTAISGLAKRQAQATAWATEKMEAIRAIKESSTWATFCASSGTDAPGTGFSRVADVACSSPGGKDQAVVTVKVSWAERGTTKTSTQTITFYRR